MECKDKAEACSDYEMVSKRKIKKYCLEGAMKSKFEETSILNTSQQNQNNSIRTDIKMESCKPNDISTEIKHESEELSMSDARHQNKIDFFVKSKNKIKDEHKASTETEIKVKPLTWENRSAEIKCESETPALHDCQENGMDIAMDSKTVTGVCSEDQEVNTKMEIKEELQGLQTMCTETVLSKTPPDSGHRSQYDMQAADSSTDRITTGDFPQAGSAELHTEGMDRDDASLSTPCSSATEHPANSSVTTANEIPQIHGTEGQYICDTCGQGFSKRISLIRHRLNLQRKKPYKCIICNKMFTLMINLIRHTLFHERNTSYKCETCGMSFPSISHLKTHILNHKGSKPYRCKVCGKRFAMLQHFKDHIVAHYDRYECDICEKSFNHPSKLKAHVLTHVPQRPHKCNVCGKKFAYLPVLNAHKFVHEIADPLMIV